jgi:N-acetylglucosaminyldiphosphoundecaprenol N-acetyl-beta-D-mannosaminyltransferase
MMAGESNRGVEMASLFGIPIRKVTMGQVLERADRAISGDSSLNIGVVNAAKIVNMQRDAALSDAVLSSDEIYADGMSVVWASRLLGDSLPERIAGIDLMHSLLDVGGERGYRFYLLGATQEVIEKAVAEISRMYPRAQIGGYRNGYFNEDDERGIAQEIKRAEPDVLFVAMTSPKKEQFMARWADHMSVPVVHGVGGSFDVLAGQVKRAPRIWQKLGLEWLFRVLQEPRRLWRRYLFTNVAFVRLLLREYLAR